MAKAERRMITWRTYRQVCCFGEGGGQGRCFMPDRAVRCRREACTEWPKLRIVKE